ncbi:hypothetical protein FOZ62_019597, partial [Perkinsus olseni]
CRPSRIGCLALLVVLSVAQFCKEAHASRWSWPIHRYLLLPMSTVMFVADSLLSKRVVTRLREHHRQTTLGICIVQNLLSLPMLIVLIAITEETRESAALQPSEGADVFRQTPRQSFSLISTEATTRLWCGLRKQGCPACCAVGCHYR